MATMIREIQLLGDRFESYKGVEPGNRIEGLNTLNVFIGPNNAGKSRLLRAIFAENELQCATDATEIEALRTTIEEVQKAAEDIKRSEPEMVLRYPDAFKIIEQLRCPFYSRGEWPMDTGFRNLLQSHKDANRMFRVLQSHTETANLHEPLANLDRNLSTIPAYQPNNPNWHRIYIPTLRGLRPIDSESDSYRNRTINDYFRGELGPAPQAKQSFENDTILTGQTYFDSVRRFLLGTLQQREAIDQYQRFLSRSFFDGEEVTLIPREGEDVLYVKIGREKEQPIFHLGDGIQQIIIQTLPLALHADKNLILCVEEPELYLHPGYQRLLIERFLDTTSCQGHQVFVATHSQQFLDMTLDHSNISVYRVTKQHPEQHDGDEWTPTFKVTQRSGHDRVILQELGVRNSSVLLANCTIWVEGITDRMYTRHFLNLWQNQAQKTESEDQRLFQEDIHYAFVEYSGNNITHWSFLDDSDEAMKPEWLCGEVFLIADKDSGKEDRHEKLRKFLGDRAYILPCREIENLLTPEVIRSVIKCYEKEKEVEFRNFKQETYANRGLGRFIQNSVLAKDYTVARKGGYAEKSGTIKDKLGFAKRAIDAMTSFEELSPAAQDLTQAIISFIRDKNPA